MIARGHHHRCRQLLERFKRHPVLGRATVIGDVAGDHDEIELALGGNVGVDGVKCGAGVIAEAAFRFCVSFQEMGVGKLPDPDRHRLPPLILSGH